jgi:hypothetical protein
MNRLRRKVPNPTAIAFKLLHPSLVIRLLGSTALLAGVAAAEQPSPLIGKWCGKIEGQHMSIDGSRCLIVNSVDRDGTANAIWGGRNPRRCPAQAGGDDITMIAPAGIVRLRRQWHQLVGTFTVTWENGGAGRPSSAESARYYSGQVYPVTLSRTDQ